MRTFCLCLVTILLHHNAACAGLSHAQSWQTVSDDEQFLLVMVSPLPVDEDVGTYRPNEESRSIRATYTQSGLYRNDGSTQPLWTIPYRSQTTAFLFSDGKHLVIADESWRHSYGHVASFYASGKLLAKYNMFDLEPHYRWSCRLFNFAECRDVQIDNFARTLTVRSNQGETFVFDVTTGAIIRRSSRYPQYFAIASGFGVALVAVVGWLVWRPRRKIVET